MPVVTINDGTRPRGETSFLFNASNGHITHGSMTVSLNNGWGWTPEFRREVTCHELGHALGPLDEGSQSGSCMMGGAPYVDTATPHDYNVIESVYNH